MSVSQPPGQRPPGLRSLLTRDMVWKVALALVGCVATGFIIEEVVGGAVGWTICGAILGATCYPLFKTALERRGLAINGRPMKPDA